MTRLLTLAEVADQLRCSVRTVQRLIRSGHLRVTRVASKPLISEREVEAYVSASYRRSA